MGLERLNEVRASFVADLDAAGTDPAAVEKLRVDYAGRKSGLLQELTAALRELPNEDKRDYGQALNAHGGKNLYGNGYQCFGKFQVLRQNHR